MASSVLSSSTVCGWPATAIQSLRRATRHAPVAGSHTKRAMFILIIPGSTKWHGYGTCSAWTSAKGPSGLGCCGCLACSAQKHTRHSTLCRCGHPCNERTRTWPATALMVASTTSVPSPAKAWEETATCAALTPCARSAPCATAASSCSFACACTIASNGQPACTGEPVNTNLLNQAASPWRCRSLVQRRSSTSARVPSVHDGRRCLQVCAPKASATRFGVGKGAPLRAARRPKGRSLRAQIPQCRAARLETAPEGLAAPARTADRRRPASTVVGTLRSAC